MSFHTSIPCTHIISVPCPLSILSLTPNINKRSRDELFDMRLLSLPYLPPESSVTLGLSMA